MTRVYEEIIVFIAGGTTSADVAGYQPSDDVKRRLSDLLDRHKAELLTPDEAAELDHYLELEHIMRLAKARARGQQP